MVMTCCADEVVVCFVGGSVSVFVWALCFFFCSLCVFCLPVGFFFFSYANALLFRNALRSAGFAGNT